MLLYKVSYYKRRCDITFRSNSYKYPFYYLR